MDILQPIDIQLVKETAEKCDFSLESIGQPRWECLDWEDNSNEQATGTRIRLMFPYHQPVGNLSLPLDPLPGSSLMQAHELAAFVETTFDGDRAAITDKTRKNLFINGIALSDLEICTENLPVSPGVGTKLWLDLRGNATPRLTVDRKKAIPREDVENWPSVFHGILQRWCVWLQSSLDQHSAKLAPGLLSAFAIEPELRLKMPAKPQICSWQLNADCRSVDQAGRWLTALLGQALKCTSSFPRDPSFRRGFSYSLSLAFQRLPHELERNPAFSFSIDRDIALALMNNFVFSSNLGNNDHNSLVYTIAQSRVGGRIIGYPVQHSQPPSVHEKGIILSNRYAQTLALSNAHIYTCLESSVALHLLPEAFADDLSRSFPALGVCGLNGRAGDGWLVAPGWIEWDINPVTAEVCKESPKQQWSQSLLDKSYDLIFPLTNIPLGRLRRNCPEWRSDRSYRALGVLAYFLLGSEEWFKGQNQKFLDLFKVPHIHALMPKPELWLKRFDDWMETDWNTCGLSALWDIESGVVYWAEGAHKADDMKRVGKPINQFIDSEK